MKINKLFFCALFFVTSAINVHAQEDEHPQCGFDLIDENHDPATPLPANFSRSNAGTYIIPVVVHVIHNNGSENISDTQILSGINEMNAQYSGAEGGTDSEIEFRLATLDPDGNCTNGIIRVQTPFPSVKLSGPTNGCFLTDLQKCDLSRWPASDYMNVWIVEKISNGPSTTCNDGGIRGYSRLPPASPLFDGITVKYKHFGTIETAAYGDMVTNINTDTHEAGHYLGLYHPFVSSSCNSSCEMIENSDCNTHGDRVCDTDPCNDPAATNDCSISPLSCLNCDGFDFTNYNYPRDNYMSYNTLCHIRFTPGQIERMHGIIETYRSNLFSLSNLTETGTSDLIYSQQIVLTPSITSSTCDNPTGNGAISLVASNGSGNYSFIWSTGATTSGISGLSGGWYSVEVQDNLSNCNGVIQSFYVPSPHLTFNVSNTCIYTEEGAIDITVHDGLGNVLTNNAYVWSNGATTEDIANVGSGNYSVMVTTALGCVLEQDFTIDFIQRPIISASHIETIQPDCEQTLGSIFTNINSFGNAATFIYEWKDALGNVVGTSQNLENASSGTYTVTVTNPFIGCTSAPYPVTINPAYTFDYPGLYSVTTQEAMSGNYSFLEGIEVQSGGVLTISGSNFKFAPEAGITVHPGGRLNVLNNTHLENVDCADYWQGIKVLGNSTYSQIGSDAQYQGRCDIKNSTVENAWTGITNSSTDSWPILNSGGIIVSVRQTHLPYVP